MFHHLLAVYQDEQRVRVTNSATSSLYLAIFEAAPPAPGGVLWMI
jgi:hypothetical protein